MKNITLNRDIRIFMKSTLFQNIDFRMAYARKNGRIKDESFQ